MLISDCYQLHILKSTPCCAVLPDGSFLLYPSTVCVLSCIPSLWYPAEDTSSVFEVRLLSSNRRGRLALLFLSTTPLFLSVVPLFLGVWRWAGSPSVKGPLEHSHKILCPLHMSAAFFCSSRSFYKQKCLSRTSMCVWARRVVCDVSVFGHTRRIQTAVRCVVFGVAHDGSLGVWREVWGHGLVVRVRVFIAVAVCRGVCSRVARNGRLTTWGKGEKKKDHENFTELS